MTSEKTEKVSFPKLLSIIIPAYNTGKYLDDCLASCTRQNLPPEKYEIIIVNDGSTDGTQQIADRWAAERHNIKVISQENKGLSVARNAGIDASAGKYIMFIDSDDTIAENCLGGLTARCMADDLDMLRFCAANIIGNVPSRRFSYKDAGIVSGKDLLKEDFQVCAPFALYKKDFLKKSALEFHPGIYHEDNEFTPKAYWHADKGASVNDIIYFVRQTPESITRTPNPKRGYDLLNIIEMLVAFTETNVAQEYKPYFYKQISDCFNGCIKLMNSLTGNEKTCLKSKVNESRHILKYLKKSSSLSHRIEGLLMNMCPGLIGPIYTLLDRMKH